MRTKSLLPLFLISVMSPASMLWGQNTYVPDNNFEQDLIGLAVAGGGAAVAFSGGGGTTVEPIDEPPGFPTVP